VLLRLLESMRLVSMSMLVFFHVPN
jgi:hypothetical protein